MTTALLATYLAQMVAAMVTAALMLRFWSIYRRPYLWLWGWSWAALAAHELAVAVLFRLDSTTGGSADVAYIPAAVFSLITTAWQAILIVAGTWAVTRDRGVLPRGLGWWLLASAVAALVAMVAASGVFPVELRPDVMAAIPPSIAAVGYLIVAAMLLRRSPVLPGLATRMLGLTALAFVIGQAFVLWSVLSPVQQSGVISPAFQLYYLIAELLLQNVLALGMLVWLLEIERHRAAQSAEALTESQARLARLFHDVRLIAWEFDTAERRFTYVSPQAEELLGYSLEQWLEPQFWYHHLHPEDRDTASALSRAHVQRGEDYEVEYRMLHKDGSVLWFRDLTSVVLRDGRPERLHGLLLDITQRRHVEQALSFSEQRLRGIFEAAVDPLWDWDVVANQTEFSPSWPRLLQWPAHAETPPPPWDDLLHPDDRPKVLTLLEASLRHDDVLYEAEYRLRTYMGGWKWVLSRGRVVNRDDQGRPLRMVGSITDITERILSEQSVRESEARLRAVIDNAPNVAIQGYDLAGRVLFWNKAAENMFGWTEKEALGRTLDQLMLDASAAEEFTRSLAELNRGGSPVLMPDTRFARRDGSGGWCMSVVFRIPGGATPTFICMDVDISERKVAEQALQRSANLQRLLLSELDHRVRNNLASLTALIDISSRDSESVEELANSIRTRVQAMSVVHALLSSEHWRSVDLTQLLTTLAPGRAGRAIHVEGPEVHIVPRQATALGMVLQELIANSQKYGALAAVENGSIDVRWTIAPADHDGDVKLHLLWRESGGLAINRPVNPGVGLGLIEGLVRTELNGKATLRFPERGADHEFNLVLERVPEDDGLALRQAAEGAAGVRGDL